MKGSSLKKKTNPQNQVPKSESNKKKFSSMILNFKNSFYVFILDNPNYKNHSMNE